MLKVHFYVEKIDLEMISSMSHPVNKNTNEDKKSNNPPGLSHGKKKKEMTKVGRKRLFYYFINRDEADTSQTIYGKQANTNLYSKFSKTWTNCFRQKGR